jgi:hypothetical protein
MFVAGRKERSCGCWASPLGPTFLALIGLIAFQHNSRPPLTPAIRIPYNASVSASPQPLVEGRFSWCETSLENTENEVSQL